MTIYVNFFLHCEDFISVHSQHATRRLAELFARYGIKGDFYLRGMVVERMMAEAPEAIDTLKRTGMPIGYHSDHHAPYPTPWQHVRDLSWDEPVEYMLYRETHHLDPLTGELTDERPNQMTLLTEVFDGPPLVTIGAPAAQGGQGIRYAQHQLGVPMASAPAGMLGLPLLWQNGMLRGPWGPRDYFYLIERFIKPRCGRPASAGELPAMLDRQLDLIPTEEDSMISVAGHDFSFALTDGWIGCYVDPETREHRNPSVLRASPPLAASEREGIMHLYETVVAYFARRPDVEVVTCEDVLGWVEPLPEEQTLSTGQVLAVAENVLAGWGGPGYPPPHVEVDDRMLSLAECFQALVHALAGYRRDGALPEEIVVRDLLGPTDTPMSLAVTDTARGMDRFLLDGGRVCELAAGVEAKMSDRIPGVVGLSGSDCPLPPMLGYFRPRPEGVLNPAEFLYLAAQVVQSLGRTGELGQALVTGANLLPELAKLRWTSDGWPPFYAVQEGYTMREWLSELQAWTIKPAKLRG